MGAMRFKTYGIGTTMHDAYNNAVQEALSRYGSDAYNGTISTTSGFHDVTEEFKRSGKTIDEFGEARQDDCTSGDSPYGICITEPIPSEKKGMFKSVGKYVFFGKGMYANGGCVFDNGGEVDAKTKALTKQIASDFESFRPDGDSGTIDDIGDNYVIKEFRDLGQWEHDEERRQDDDFDESDFEDDDQEVWANGEHKKYFTRFKDWAKDYSWFDKVSLHLDTSEKNYCEFTIKVISEKEKEEQQKAKEQKEKEEKQKTALSKMLGYDASKMISELSYYKTYYLDKRRHNHNSFSIYWKNKEGHVNYKSLEEVFSEMDKPETVAKIYNSANPISELSVQLYGWSSMDTVKYNERGHPIKPDGSIDWNKEGKTLYCVGMLDTVNIENREDFVKKFNAWWKDFKTAYRFYVLEEKKPKAEKAPEKSNEFMGVGVHDDFYDDIQVVVVGKGAIHEGNSYKKAKAMFDAYTDVNPEKHVIILDNVTGKTLLDSKTALIERLDKENYERFTKDLTFVEKYKDYEIWKGSEDSYVTISPAPKYNTFIVGLDDSKKTGKKESVKVGLKDAKAYIDWVISKFDDGGAIDELTLADLQDEDEMYDQLAEEEHLRFIMYKKGGVATAFNKYDIDDVDELKTLKLIANSVDYLRKKGFAVSGKNAGSIYETKYTIFKDGKKIKANIPVVELVEYAHEQGFLRKGGIVPSRISTTELKKVLGRVPDYPYETHKGCKYFKKRFSQDYVLVPKFFTGGGVKYKSKYSTTKEKIDVIRENGDFFEVEFTFSYYEENTGIGSYEYWGSRGFDKGDDVYIVEDITWDKTKYSDEDNKLIAEHVKENFDEMSESLKLNSEYDYAD